jgi:parvulin-like peptidyl-prolyl isomerase
LAKKQKKATSDRVPTKHQLSKWQRQMKIRRIVIIAAVVFLVGISSWVGYESYADYKARVGPSHEIAIEVNGVPSNMEFFVKMLDIYIGNYINTTVNTYVDFYMQAYNATREEIVQWLTSNAISDLSKNTNNITDMIIGTVADDIINAELLRQGAESLNITVTSEEIDARLNEAQLPDNEAYRDIIRATLLQEKLEKYFGSNLTDTMEQAHVQVMLVETEEVADEVMAKVEAGSNFTALAEEFSCNNQTEGDLGWLPTELMPNILIANAAFNLTLGEISQPIYDETAIKDVGYWLIEVTDKQDEAINASAMLLGSEAEAEQVKAQLAAGGNFSALAGNYSQHESKTKGGKLAGLKRGAMNSTAFDAVAFNLTLNVVSAPVKDESVHTKGGYWLVNVVDRGDQELEEKVKEGLIDKHFNDWFEEWKENSTIENRLDASKISWAVSKVLEGR